MQYKLLHTLTVAIVPFQCSESRLKAETSVFSSIPFTHLGIMYEPHKRLFDWKLNPMRQGRNSILIWAGAAAVRTISFYCYCYSDSVHCCRWRMFFHYAAFHYRPQRSLWNAVNLRLYTVLSECTNCDWYNGATVLCMCIGSLETVHIAIMRPYRSFMLDVFR